MSSIALPADVSRSVTVLGWSGGDAMLATDGFTFLRVSQSGAVERIALRERSHRGVRIPPQIVSVHGRPSLIAAGCLDGRVLISRDGGFRWKDLRTLGRRRGVSQVLCIDEETILVRTKPAGRPSVSDILAGKAIDANHAAVVAATRSESWTWLASSSVRMETMTVTADGTVFALPNQDWHDEASAVSRALLTLDSGSWRMRLDIDSTDVRTTAYRCEGMTLVSTGPDLLVATSHGVWRSDGPRFVRVLELNAWARLVSDGGDHVAAWVRGSNGRGLSRSPPRDAMVWRSRDGGRTFAPLPDLPVGTEIDAACFSGEGVLYLGGSFAPPREPEHPLLLCE